MYRFIVLAIVSSISFADSHIYEYIDKSGNLVISNKPQSSGNRYKILQEELSHEKQALNDAKEALKNKPAPPKQEQLLNNSIKEHQKNIDILNKQLGNTP